MIIEIGDLKVKYRKKCEMCDDNKSYYKITLMKDYESNRIDLYMCKECKKYMGDVIN